MSSLTPLLSGNTFNNHRQNLQVTNTVIMWYHIYSVRRSMFIITEQFLSGIYSFETRLFPFLANRMFLTNWNKMVRSYSINRLEVKVFRSLRLKNFLPLWLKVCMRIRIHFHGPHDFGGIKWSFNHHKMFRNWYYIWKHSKTYFWINTLQGHLLVDRLLWSWNTISVSLSVLVVIGVILWFCHDVICDRFNELKKRNSLYNL